jgi:hypothetical protein
VLNYLGASVLEISASAECCIWLALLCDLAHLGEHLTDFGRRDETLVVERQDDELGIDRVDQ